MFRSPAAAELFKTRDKKKQDGSQDRNIGSGDEVSTTEIENAFDNTSDEEVPEDFYHRHNVNMAKFLLGKDGGYTKEQIKQIYKNERAYQK